MDTHLRRDGTPGDASAAPSPAPLFPNLAAAFAKQARMRPDAAAVVFGDASLTYRELDERASRLAGRLARLGVGAGTPVGLGAERSLETIVGILGIVKAGGAYVPLDPAYPPARLAVMRERAGLSLVIGPAHLAHTAGEAAFLDVADETVPGPDPRANPGPDDLVNVVFTSGTTGEPKGVEVLHRGILRLVLDADYVDLSPDHTLLQLSSLSFDASTFEIWGALLNGARLVVAPPHTPSLDEIGALLSRHGVTTLWLTAGLFHVMVDRRLQDLAPLTQLLAGGDVLSVAHVRRFRRALPHVRLVNGYGPTETTTFAVCHTIGDVPEDASSIPIGRPISRTRAYLLDADLAPVPDGAPGELFIGGDGVARGYAGRPDLTAERFLTDPFDPSGASRLYRTGDRVRRRPDGALEFLGRADEQVKIRGYRIELAEVARALAQHPSVADAVVAARGDGTDAAEKRVVAWIVARSGASVSADELRTFLRALLPEFMLPAAFVFLESLPLNENGKVDRRALPDPPAGAPRTAALPPLHDTAALLERIWRDILGREAVDVRANFFDQ
jgi:aspartate racemase